MLFCPPLFLAAVLCGWMTFENFRPDSGFQNHCFKFCLYFFGGGSVGFQNVWVIFFVGLFLLPINSVSDSLVKLTYSYCNLACFFHSTLILNIYTERSIYL